MVDKETMSRCLVAAKVKTLLVKQHLVLVFLIPGIFSTAGALVVITV